MADNIQWGPIATLMSAVMSAALTFSLTYFWTYKRKIIHFDVFSPEELSNSLKKHGKNISINFDGSEIKELNRSILTVKNRGNSTVKDLTFTLDFPGAESLISVDLSRENAASPPNLIMEKTSDSVNSVKCKISFLNPTETVPITTFFDGIAERPLIRCRLEDVRVRISLHEATDIAEINKEFTPLMPWSAWVALSLFVMIISYFIGANRYYNFDPSIIFCSKDGACHQDKQSNLERLLRESEGSQKGR